MNTGFTALVENIYFSSTLTTQNWNDYVTSFGTKLQEDNLKIIEMKELYILDNVQVIRGIARYSYGFSIADKYRIFIAQKITDNYPIYCIINAQFLHLHNVFHVMAEAMDTILQILEYYTGNHHSDSELSFKLSRIDICNHTTKIDLQKYIKPNEYFSRACTKLKKVYPVIEKVGESDQETSYFRYGSGSLAVRFYNKVREICEMQYKAFFFQKWKDLGLIDERTQQIYEMTYKLFRDYRIDFIYSHIKYHQKDIAELDIITADSCYNGNQSEGFKLNILMDIINKYKIKFVKEVINVEYQVRGEYLKSLRIAEFENKDKNTMIKVLKNTDIFDILENINIIYEYLTKKAFRIVDRKSKAKRIRDKTIDPIWQEIQKCKIINSTDSYELDKEKIKVYHEYNKNMEDTHTLNNIIARMARLYYLNVEEIDINSIDTEEVLQSMSLLYNRLDTSENLMKLEERLAKQVVMYGEKNKLRQ